MFYTRKKRECGRIIRARGDADNPLAGGGQHGFRVQHHLRAIRHTKPFQARERQQRTGKVPRRYAPEPRLHIAANDIHAQIGPPMQ